MKRRFFALTLVFAIVFTSLFSLTSCGEKYEHVESTEEEKTTVIKISYEKEKYEVSYELYRAFFLQYKSLVDGGNEEVWTGADKESYENRIDELIYKSIAEIYAVFHLCDKAGINVYSNSFDKQIEEARENSIEGDTQNGGFGGDFSKYLEALKKINHNDSTATLILRYHLARQSLLEYYVGALDDDDINEESKPGTIKYTKDEVQAFYLNPESSRRIIKVEFPEHLTKAQAEEKRTALTKIINDPEKDFTDVIIYIANQTLANPVSEVIGRHTYDTLYYSDMTESAFSIGEGQVSELIALNTGDFGGYSVVYRLPPDADFFEDNYDSIVDAYLLDEFGQIVANTASNIIEAIEETDTLKTLDRSKVSMN